MDSGQRGLPYRISVEIRGKPASGMTMGRLRNLCDDPGKCSSEPLAERSEPGESVPELAYVAFQPGDDVAHAVAASEVLQPGQLAGGTEERRGGERCGRK